MSEVQAPENKSFDPRWITLRVSRINLGITIFGALLAFPVMMLIGGMDVWIRMSLLAGFVASMAWDLQLILLKGRDSVGAFYLFDLDPVSPLAAPDPSGMKKKVRADSPRLGIRIRFANAANHPASSEQNGLVLTRAFVSPWFTALRYHLPGDAAWRRWWPRVIPLWADSLDAGDFRGIRVALKWK
ncbi:MAG: hypothetical protein IPP88_19775 [Betaproteobacteria bacterium]|nr:hypothetical protein [Betaproteobacteria bacterium]